MLDDLKSRVYHANLELVRLGLVIDTWGNVSGIDRAADCVVIKPSGMPYEELKPRDMVVVSLQAGSVVEGGLKPSSDTPTHLAIYRAFESVGGVVHTHSLYATAWAQACRDIPCLGTTHADYFHGAVPCTRQLRAEEIQASYEANTGKVIVERLDDLDPLHSPAVLVACHGPFAWGETAEQAVQNAHVLEHVARLAAISLGIRADLREIGRDLLDKHFLRKHGPTSTYGQKDKTTHE